MRNLPDVTSQGNYVLIFSFRDWTNCLRETNEVLVQQGTGSDPQHEGWGRRLDRLCFWDSETSRLFEAWRKNQFSSICFEEKIAAGVVSAVGHKDSSLFSLCCGTTAEDLHLFTHDEVLQKNMFLFLWRQKSQHALGPFLPDCPLRLTAFMTFFPLVVMRRGPTETLTGSLISRVIVFRGLLTSLPK